MKHLNFKKMVSTAAAFACMFASITVTPVAVETEADAASGMSAFEITEQMTIGWNLGNTLDAYDSTGKTTGLDTETCWGQPKTTQAMIDAVKAKGFNTIRIPTTWYAHLDGNNQIDPAWLARVKEIVDYCMNDDLYVILNVHHEETWINVPQFTDQTYQEAEKKLTAIWSQLAETFKDYDQHLVFEGMNEPRQTGNPNVNQWGNGSGDNGYTWNYINKLNAKFIETVRGQGSDANKERLLMCPGYCASSDIDAIRAVQFPANSGNVAYSVHAYLPYYFTMANDDKANHSYPGKSGWGEDYTGAINYFFDNLKKLEAEKNTPVVIGEFSSSNFNNLNDRKAWAKDYMTGAKEAGIPCVLWDNNCDSNPDNPGEAHGYFNRSALSWYSASEPVIDTMMNVINDDSILWNGHKKAAIKDEPAVTTTSSAPAETTTTAPAETTTVSSNSETTTTTEPVATTTTTTSTPDDFTFEVVKKAVTLPSGAKKSVTVEIKGAPNASIGGGFGFSNGPAPDDWKNIEWKGMADANGALTVEIDLSEVPESVTYGEIQVWWSNVWNNATKSSTDKPCEIVSYKVTAGEAPATTTTEATTTTATTSTTTTTTTTTETTTTTSTTTTTTAPETTTTTSIVETSTTSEPVTSTTKETETTTAPVKADLYGDANLDGKVTIADAVAILQHIGNRDKYGLKPQGQANADVDGKAGVTGSDALTLQQVDAGKYKVTDLPLKSA